MHGPHAPARHGGLSGVDDEAPTVVLGADELASLRDRPVGSRHERAPGAGEAAGRSALNARADAERPDRSLGLALAVAAAVAGLVLAVADVGAPAIRLLVAVPLVVFAPGYALMAAACPGPSVTGAERLALSIGASLGATVVGGLALHWTPWGLRPDAWAVVLSGLTLTAATVAFARRRHSPPAASNDTKISDAMGTTRAVAPASSAGRGSALLAGAAVLIVATTVYVARTSAAGHATAGFTQVWMLPTEEGGRPSVRLGVHSREASRSGYRLQLDVDSVPLASWPDIALAAGETWETTAALPPTPAEGGIVEARLYRAGNPAEGTSTAGDAPYRRVVLRR